MAQGLTPVADPFSMDRGGTRASPSREHARRLATLGVSLLSGLLVLVPTADAVAAARRPRRPHRRRGRLGPGARCRSSAPERTVRQARIASSGATSDAGDAWAQAARSTSSARPRLDARLRRQRRRLLSLPARHARDPQVLRAGGGEGVRAGRRRSTPSIAFPDLDPTQSFYRWANIAVKMGWMRRSATDASCRTSRSRWPRCIASIVLALGMRSHGEAARRTSTPATASRSPPRQNFGTHDARHAPRPALQQRDEADHDVGPQSPMPRSQVAYLALQGEDAARRGSSRGSAVTVRRRSCCRRWAPPARRSCEWGLKYVGLSLRLGRRMGLRLARAGRAGRTTDRRVRLLGLDVVACARDDGGVLGASPRPDRTRGGRCPSAPPRTWPAFGNLKCDALLPGDLMFYDGNGDGTVDHVGPVHRERLRARLLHHARAASRSCGWAAAGTAITSCTGGACCPTEVALSSVPRSPPAGSPVPPR